MKNNQSKNRKGLALLAFSLGFFIFTLPYLFFVRKELGYWAISGKSGYNFYTYFSSAYQKYGLGPTHLQTSHQESKEIAVKSDKANYKPFSFGIHHPWVVSKKAMKNIMRIIFDKIPSSLTYNFALILLFGIFLKRKRISYKGEEIFLLSFPLLAIFGYSFFEVYNRLFTFVIPLLIAWTAVGFLELERVAGRKRAKYILLFLVLPSVFYFSYEPILKSMIWSIRRRESG
jgi:hypothetical protein